MKKLAPYGKRLQELLSKHQVPNNDVYMFMGRFAWTKAKGFIQSRFVLVLPPNSNKPADFIWPVSNCEVLLFDTSGCSALLIQEMGYELLKSKAAIVRVVLFDGKMVVYSRGDEI